MAISPAPEAAPCLKKQFRQAAPREGNLFLSNSIIVALSDQFTT
jgi:hypothetical protein